MSQPDFDGKRKRIVWTHAHYVKALAAIRESGLFKGFDYADGYRVSKRPVKEAMKAVRKIHPDKTPEEIYKLSRLPQFAYTHRKGYTFTKYQRQQIKRHNRIVTVVASKPHVFYAPKERTFFVRVRKALGFTTTKLKVIPFAAVPGAGLPTLTVVPRKGYIIAEYPERNMRQIVVGVDMKKIIKSVDLSGEESTVKDEVSLAIQVALQPFADDVDNGSTVFRLHTSSGDINPATYKPAMNSKIMADHVSKLISRYFDPKVDTELFISGFSAWQRLFPHGRLWRRGELDMARHDFTSAGRPRKTPRSAREKAKGRK